MKKLMNAYEIAAEIGVSHGTIYNWLKRGLPYVEKKRGTRIFKMFTLDDVEKWIERNTK